MHQSTDLHLLRSALAECQQDSPRDRAYFVSDKAHDCGRNWRKKRERQEEVDGEERKVRRGREEGERTAIRNKCASRLSYQGDRCIIIG